MLAVRSSWGLMLAKTGDVSLLFVLLVLACAGVAVWFLIRREYVGAVVAAFVAVVLAVFLL